MKIIISFVLIICSVLISLETVRAQKRRCEILDEACSVCLYMQSCISFQRTEPAAIIMSYPDGSALLCGLCRTALENGCEFHEAWKAALHSPELSVLSSDERKLMLSIGEELGFTDTKGETTRLGRIYQQIDLMTQKAKGELEQKRRLYLTTGTLTGVFLTIILI